MDKISFWITRFGRNVTENIQNVKSSVCQISNLKNHHLKGFKATFLKFYFTFLVPRSTIYLQN